MFTLTRIRLMVLIILSSLLAMLTNVSIVGASNGSVSNACDPFGSLSARNFAQPTNINNPWYSLVPGTQFIMDGTAAPGGTTGAHRIVFTVTDLVKVINGVTTRVMWDVDTQDGVLAESELAFQAQDNSKNVWVLGEYPEEYDATGFTGAPFTWISGVAKAKGGVLVPGKPKVGTDAFIEGYSPSIDFWDCGQVIGTGRTLTVNEWAPLDPTGGTQQKYYTLGIGNTKIGSVDDPLAETLNLTAVIHLSPTALANARKAALKLDKHAYQVSGSVYGGTQPAYKP